MVASGKLRFTTEWHHCWPIASCQLHWSFLKWLVYFNLPTVRVTFTLLCNSTWQWIKQITRLFFQPIRKNYFRVFVLLASGWTFSSLFLTSEMKFFCVVQFLSLQVCRLWTIWNGVPVAQSCKESHCTPTLLDRRVLGDAASDYRSGF